MATSTIKPVHAGIDVAFTIATSSWAADGSNYAYTWTDSRVTQGCRVEVSFASSNTASNINSIAYEKVSGGVKFIATSTPTAGVSVVVHIINAQTGNVSSPTGADVSTTVISGAANVNEALTSLNSKLTNIQIQVFESFTVSANSYLDLWDNNLKNKLIVGYEMHGAQRGLSIQMVSSDQNGLRVRVMNDSSADRSPSKMLVRYIG